MKDLKDSRMKEGDANGYSTVQKNGGSGTVGFEIEANEYTGAREVLGEKEIQGEDEGTVGRGKFNYAFVFLFAFISLTDGFLIGYAITLGGIFTEKGVSSEKRSVLLVIMSSYILKMFVAPITDKFFIPSIGKRKTYLLPSKLFFTAIYGTMSFFIDEWVDSDNLWMIAFSLLLVSIVALFEVNAMVGFKLDFFGQQDAGSAASSTALGILFGLSLGLQIFTALNSAYICEMIFGVPKALIDHRGILQTISVLSFIAFLVILTMPDNSKNPSDLVQPPAGPLKVIRSIFRIEALRKSLIWNFCGPTLVLGMKLVASQYYIKQGVRREDYVIVVGIVTVPALILSNIVWINIVKWGRLMLMFWITVLNAAFIEYLNAFNSANFRRDDNYRSTLIFICIISCLDIFANWHMIQQSFVLGSSPKHYTLTYIQTINSLIVSVRSIPLLIMNMMVDHLSITVYFSICIVIQLAISISTYTYINSIDNVKLSDIGDRFVTILNDSRSNDELIMIDFDKLD